MKNYKLNINNVVYDLSPKDYTATVTQSSPASGDITIPREIESDGMSFRVISLGNRAFHSSSISSLSFPEDSEVTSFGTQCFFNSQIKRIVFPPKLCQIGRGWCSDAPLLEKIELFESSKDTNYISENDAIFTKDKSTILFCQRSVESFNIPSIVSRIDIFSFSIKNLKTVTFSADSKLTFICGSAFRGSNITTIEFPSSLQTIGDFSFKDCQNLETVIFQRDSKLSTLGPFCFSNTKLKEVVLFGPLTSIGMGCFKDTNSLSKVVVSDSVSLTVFNDSFSGVSPEFTLYLNQKTMITGAGAPENVKRILDQQNQNETDENPSNPTNDASSANDNISTKRHSSDINLIKNNEQPPPTRTASAPINTVSKLQAAKKENDKLIEGIIYLQRVFEWMNKQPSAK